MRLLSRSSRRSGPGLLAIWCRTRRVVSISSGVGWLSELIGNSVPDGAGVRRVEPLRECRLVSHFQRTERDTITTDAGVAISCASEILRRFSVSMEGRWRTSGDYTAT